MGKSGHSLDELLPRSDDLFDFDLQLFAGLAAFHREGASKHLLLTMTFCPMLSLPNGIHSFISLTL